VLRQSPFHKSFEFNTSCDVVSWQEAAVINCGRDLII
jgi:hypothetical protein